MTNAWQLSRIETGQAFSLWSCAETTALPDNPSLRPDGTAASRPLWRHTAGSKVTSGLTSHAQWNTISQTRNANIPFRLAA